MKYVPQNYSDVVRIKSINFSFRFCVCVCVCVYFCSWFTFRRIYMIWEENWSLKKPHFKHDIWPQRDSFPLWKVCKLHNRDTGMEEIEGKKLRVFYRSSWWAITSLAPRGEDAPVEEPSVNWSAPALWGPVLLPHLGLQVWWWCWHSTTGFFVFLFFAALGLFALCWLSLVAVSGGGYSLLWCVGFLLQRLLLLQSTASRREGFGSCNGRTQ